MSDGSPVEPGADTEAGGIIRREIREGGAMPFARFMELALYAPGAGYYERAGRAIGRAGDFYTSVSVGPVFGFLLAQRFAGWVEALDPVPERVDLVEAAAHDGRLAADVLGSLRRFAPAVLERVAYTVVEPSTARRGVQEATLSEWRGRVRWVEDLRDLGRGVTGVIFSNELLDAFPVHRFEWDAGRRCWWESGVGLDGSGESWRPVWCRLPAGAAGEPPPAWPAPLLDVLPDGFVAESCPGARTWWTRAAGCLERGWLWTADYGFDEGDAIRPERTDGTLRAYHRHRHVDDLLARPGEQDLTAHVDFPAIRDAGERAGLATEAFRAQGRWLGELAVGTLARGGGAAAWLAARGGQWQTLTHPLHLGRAMKVLVQRR